jgi:YD repeat-containing protein
MTFVEVRGDPQQTTEGKITRDPRTGRVTEISRRAEYAARGGIPASVRREVALLKRRHGGWARVMTAWLDDAVIGRETIEVEGTRPRSARSVEFEGRWSFEYNKRGQLIAQHDTDARKDYAAIYDASGRLSAEQLNQSSRRIWSYDDEGLIKSLEITEDQSGARGVLEASWGAQRQELRCVAAPAQAGLAPRRVLWSATRRGDACGMDYDDWVALSALCIDAARTREGG